MAAVNFLSLCIALLLTLTLTLTLTHSASDVVLLLQKIKPSLQGTAENLLLLSWNTSVPLCQWRGLNGLSAMALLCSCELIIWAIPLELGYSTSLSDIDLSHNLLEGSLPTSIWNLCDRLISLRLHGNSLSGSLPEPALPDSTCKNLQFLDLGQNTFSGNFPDFIVGFHGLKQLDIGDNMFSGQIPPTITELNLEKLNLSHNNFTGVLPNFGTSNFGVEVFEGNSPGLCGPPLRTCNGGSGLSSGAVAGLVIGLMTAAVVLVSLLIGYFQGKRKKNVDDDEEEEEFDEGEDEETGNGGGGDGKFILFQGGEHLTLEDVLNATGQVMEKTSYGTVYKAKLADGGTIALRLFKEGSCRDRISCLPVIKQLGRIRHENLIPLRAFYQGKEGRSFSSMTIYPTKLCMSSYMIMVPAVADEIVAFAKTDGYKAPELQQMKKCNSRTDVYAFGILLLEILLGKKPGKSSRTGEFVDLPSLVKVAVLEETTMEIFDVELLKGIRNPMEEGLVQILKLAMGCCAPVTSVRPAMDEIVRQLEENRPRNRSALYSPAETRSGSVTPF
ncbi:UNVERIFIED_CONTAM: putative kinase-like protein TMKL1 [Sesamum angustifolium]|uniref:Kinase-like protein TMKL1 n=1 Tax=Sesamum angustifolium TaxID=2727405 RepID=A0AAW2IPZ8_9LAMI